MSLFRSGDFSSVNELKALQQLLYQKGDSSDDSSIDDDDGLEGRRRRKMGPADLEPKIKQQDIDLKNKENTNEKKLVLPPELEEEKDEVEKWMENQHKEDTDILETRKRPEYKITYKQAIGTEDVFLGINNRTPGTMSCEDMIIEIEMPDETISVDEMNLEVTETHIDLKTSMYRLKLPLVHPIDPDKGSARFDTNKKSLILILRMKREYDFVHF